jgi:hypothetical protein
MIDAMDFNDVNVSDASFRVSKSFVFLSCSKWLNYKVQWGIFCRIGVMTSLLFQFQFPISTIEKLSAKDVVCSSPAHPLFLIEFADSSHMGDHDIRHGNSNSRLRIGMR